MKQSIVKIVDEILQELQSHPDPPPTETGIRNMLVGQGYNSRDIDDALKLMAPRIAAGPAVAAHSPISMRVLSDYEEAKLSRPARDALARLVLYNLIDQFELENVLDGLGQFDGEVGLEELDYLLAWAVLGTRDVEYQRTFYNVIEGRVEQTRH